MKNTGRETGYLLILAVCLFAVVCLSWEDEVVPRFLDINCSLSDYDLSICIPVCACGSVTEHFLNIGNALGLVLSRMNECI